MVSGRTFRTVGLAPTDAVPLVVDLDGTLIRSDLLVESAFAHVGASPLLVFALFAALAKGRAALKAIIASQTEIDAAILPYDERVLEIIRDARASKRSVYLASASNERYVNAIVDHLGLFDGWFASSAHENLSSKVKAGRLVENFGERGFDYIGNDRADFAVWSVARQCIAVHPSYSIRRDLLKLNSESLFLESPSGQQRQWIKLLRVHQWAKNFLVFVPLVTAHRFDLDSVAAAVGAFFVFSFAASAIYVLNDLVDIGADRNHPSKRLRPLAAGTIPIFQAIAVAPTLVILALAGALAIGPWFAAILCIYLLLTTAYTFSLKRKMMVDIVTLASLYTLREIAGAEAIAVPISEWLLGFSMFIFTALALIKRYVELAVRVDADLPDSTNRNYRKSDLFIVAALAAAAGFNSVTIFALYISSDAVRQLYRHPKALWLICPILMYWLGRCLLMAQRRIIDDDPIVFALKDWNSLLAFGLVGAIMVLSI